MAKFGIATSFIYVFGIISFRWYSFSQLKTMPLNELGDFLAGVFGPLSLFWLILGFLQQQKELQENTKALFLQHKELQRSVNHSEALVEAAKLQLKADIDSLNMAKEQMLRKSLPVFSIIKAGRSAKNGGKKKFQISFLNMGASASSVKFKSSPHVLQIDSAPPVSHFQKGLIHTLGWNDEISGEAPKKLTVTIECLDSMANSFRASFKLSLQEDDLYLWESNESTP